MLSKQKKALWASAVGYAMDGFDLLILGFVLSAVALDLQLTPPQAASLASFTLFGAVIGGVLFGVISDFFGRMKVLQFTIVFFAIFTGLCALAKGYWDLAFYRTMAGLGLGGEFGIGMALAAEMTPPEQRARASSFVGLGWQCGVLLAALCTPLLLPLIGWRGMFAIGFFPAFVSFFLRRLLHVEPAVFKPEKRKVFPLKLLLKDLSVAKISLGIFLLCSVQNFGYYSLMIWLPTYLSRQLGYSLIQSALWTVVTILGMCLGIWLFGQLADRVGRRPIFILFQSGAALMVIVFSQLTTPWALILGGAAMGCFVNGMLGGYGALISELYPTEGRATAQNMLFNLGRAVGGLGPMLMGFFMKSYSFPTMIAFLSCIYLFAICVTLFLIPERRGANLPSLDF